MSFASTSAAQFANVMSAFGQPIRIRYFSGAINGSYYDDNQVLTRSGVDIWTSGVVQPIQTPQGSSEANLMQQGLILDNDVRLFISGAVQTSGMFKVGLGSPITGEFALTQAGVVTWSPDAVPVYKKLYVRHLTNGSLVGE